MKFAPTCLFFIMLDNLSVNVAFSVSTLDIVVERAKITPTTNTPLTKSCNVNFEVLS